MKITAKHSKTIHKHKPTLSFVISLAITVMVLPAISQPGTVQSHQKISSTQGDFTGVLDNSDLLGWCALTSIDDLDDDGNNDIIVGAPFDDDGGGDRGALWIMFLNSDGTVKAYQKISATQGGFTGSISNADMFGHSVISLGDLDGDGVTDIAAGAIGDDDGISQEGAVWILFLNTDGTVKSHQKISAAQGNFTGVLNIADWFGYSLASLGDLDGDGVTDIAVGARFDSDGGPSRGAIWMLFLNTDGTVKSHQKISATQGNFTGILDNSDYFGWSVTSLDDLDGDGINDMAVGATFDDDGNNNCGAIWILFLNADGTVKTHQKISAIEGNFSEPMDSYDLFGGSITSLGDLDGDNITDIAVGAYQDDDGVGSSFNRGAVWILFLNANGKVKAHQKISQTQGGFSGILDDTDGFGTSLTRISNPDRDSIVEIAVGTYQDDDGGNNRGAIWMLFIESTPSSSSSSIGISFAETNVSCSGGNDGMIEASMSGGTPPYNYIWSDGQNTPTIIGLNAGTYFVMVIDATGTTVSGNATITQPPGVSLYLNSTLASCATADGTASILAMGGTGGFSYLWNDPAAQTTSTATGLAAGSYLVTVIDANLCINIDSVKVNNPYMMNAEVAFIADTDCNGECEGFASVIASGGIEPYSYLWSDVQNQTSVTATGLCAGEYTVTVIDVDGCSATSTLFEILEPEPISFSTSVSNSVNENCEGAATVAVSGGTPGYFYLWDDPEFQITQTATDLCSGIYNITVWDANGCSATQSITVEETIVIGVEDNLLSNIISIYPNPTAGKFTIETQSQVSQEIEINITNSIGQEIFREKLVEQSGITRKEFNLEDYPNGVYMINILNEREFLISKRITIIN